MAILPAVSGKPARWQDEQAGVTIIDKRVNKAKIVHTRQMAQSAREVVERSEMDSKVYYMDSRSQSGETSMVAKMLTVFEEAGFDKLIKPHDVVAIKTHCGEWNNTAYLRPVYARALADRIKSLGGRPFVCDTTTLNYLVNGSRVTELDILTTAERNGFTPAALGCPFICADGFMGTDDYRLDLPEGYILKEAYIAKAIAAADVLITLSHFKGHRFGVVGGAIKNLGIGAQSKRGKFNVHLGKHPNYGWGALMEFSPENFQGRNGDESWKILDDCCPFDLIHVNGNTVEWEREKCVTCLACLGPFLMNNIGNVPAEYLKACNAAMADACLATIKTVGEDKVGFINMAIDMTPGCDCVNFADTPIIPNMGVFASTDPVAIDKACIDMSREMVGIHGSTAEEKGVLDAGAHKFETCSSMAPGVSAEVQVNTGEIIGMGSKSYELVETSKKKTQDFAFPPDPRPIGIRMREKYEKLQPFPFDRYDGKGFLRIEEVDLERINK